jgi:DNA-binding response OmpR family regulator
MNVLLVEDEVRIADFVVQGFVAAGHQVSHSSDGEQALAHLLQHQPDIMILDLMLPRQSGIEVLRSVRASGRALPVLILSAKLELEDRLKGFELGADDYVPKPLYVEELIARAQVLVARNGGAIEATVQVGPFKLDRLKREVSWPEGSASLSSREYSLLELLMRSPGTLFSRQQILQQVWDINFDPQTNVVDVCIQRLKRKIEPAVSAHGVGIESVRGVGYLLKVQPRAG